MRKCGNADIYLNFRGGCGNNFFYLTSESDISGKRGNTEIFRKFPGGTGE